VGDNAGKSEYAAADSLLYFSPLQLRVIPRWQETPVCPSGVSSDPDWG